MSKVTLFCDHDLDETEIDGRQVMLASNIPGLTITAKHDYPLEINFKLEDGEYRFIGNWGDGFSMYKRDGSNLTAVTALPIPRDHSVMKFVRFAPEEDVND